MREIIFKFVKIVCMFFLIFLSPSYLLLINGLDLHTSQNSLLGMSVASSQY